MTDPNRPFDDGSVRNDPAGSVPGSAMPADTSPPRPWLRFLDAATVVAVVSGTLYVYGWLYQAGFYRYFGLSLRAVRAATPDILLSSWGVVVAILLAAPCWLLARLADRTVGSSLRPWAQNSALLLYLLLIAILWILTAPRAIPALAGTLLLVAVTAGLVALSFGGVSTFDRVLGAEGRAASLALRAASVVAMLALLAALANAQGRSAARELVLDQANYRPRVALLMSDETSWLYRRTFFLLLHADGLYYLTPLEQGDREAPLVFVLPQSDVDAAVMTRDPSEPLDDILNAIATPAS